MSVIFTVSISPQFPLLSPSGAFWGGGTRGRALQGCQIPLTQNPSGNFTNPARRKILDFQKDRRTRSLFLSVIFTILNTEGAFVSHLFRLFWGKARGEISCKLKQLHETRRDRTLSVAVVGTGVARSLECTERSKSRFRYPTGGYGAKKNNWRRLNASFPRKHSVRLFVVFGSAGIRGADAGRSNRRSIFRWSGRKYT